MLLRLVPDPDNPISKILTKYQEIILAQLKKHRTPFVDPVSTVVSNGTYEVSITVLHCPSIMSVGEQPEEVVIPNLTGLEKQIMRVANADPLSPDQIGKKLGRAKANTYLYTVLTKLRGKNLLAKDENEDVFLTEEGLTVQAYLEAAKQ